jgi:thiol:disulfide interchange protein
LKGEIQASCGELQKRVDNWRAGRNVFGLVFYYSMGAWVHTDFSGHFGWEALLYATLAAVSHWMSMRWERSHRNVQSAMRNYTDALISSALVFQRAEHRAVLATIATDRLINAVYAAREELCEAARRLPDPE